MKLSGVEVNQTACSNNDLSAYWIDGEPASGIAPGICHAAGSGLPAACHAVATKAADRHFEEVVDRYAARHRVKPGITGWAQVNGWRGETDTVEKIQKRVEYDIYYIDNWSIWLDLRIIARTLLVVFRDENAY